MIDNITFPLTFEVFKPKARLKETVGEASPAENQHLSKLKIAASMLQVLCDFGFEFEPVLADNEYGESGSSFVAQLHQLQLPYVLAIRSNHPVWLPQNQPHSGSLLAHL